MYIASMKYIKQIAHHENMRTRKQGGRKTDQPALTFLFARCMFLQPQSSSMVKTAITLLAGAGAVCRSARGKAGY